MGHISQEAIGGILDNYADAIEGGSAYRGSGTSYRGMPGSRSQDEGLKGGTDTPVTASNNGTTTTMLYAGGDWPSSRWVKADTPGFFLICTSGTAANVKAARRITGWDNTTKTFTADAFPDSTSNGDVFTIAQGFKRHPDITDIDSEESGAADSYDRVFSLTMTPGIRVPMYGAGLHTNRAAIEVRLRILKRGHSRQAKASILENAMLIREALSNPIHRGDFTQIVEAESSEPTIEIDDTLKFVMVDRLRIDYRVEASFN